VKKVKRYRVFLLASVENEFSGETIRPGLIRVRARTRSCPDRKDMYSFVEGTTEAEVRQSLEKYKLSSNLFAYYIQIPQNSDFVIIPEMVTIPDKP
jgi:hypothetical protein